MSFYYSFKPGSWDVQRVAVNKNNTKHSPDSLIEKHKYLVFSLLKMMINVLIWARDSNNFGFSGSRDSVIQPGTTLPPPSLRQHLGPGFAPLQRRGGQATASAGAGKGDLMLHGCLRMLMKLNAEAGFVPSSRQAFARPRQKNPK